MQNNHRPTISQASFGTSPNGTPVCLYTLTNAVGMVVKITNFGGIITEIHVPDKHGEFADVTLGFDNIEPYYEDGPYFGALIGRYGNRLAAGKFELDGITYQLDTNNGVNHLHGGLVGFDKVVWAASTFTSQDSVGLTLKYLSVDGDQGYPGNLQVTVIYELTNNNEILVQYHAVTDKATPINLTQHAYFNLAGHGDVLNHELTIHADYFVPITDAQIPLGEVRAVAESPFDFRTSRAIGERIAQDDVQLKNGNGYDHNYILQKNTAKQFSLAARVCEPNSGRVLEVFTEEPGIQFYSANYLDGSLTGKNWHYTRYSGFCLEPQHFPDSPNQPEFPNTILRPGEEYTSLMSYKFSVCE